jgi:hypothetical protein
MEQSPGPFRNRRFQLILSIKRINPLVHYIAAFQPVLLFNQITTASHGTKHPVFTLSLLPLPSDVSMK